MKLFSVQVLAYGGEIYIIRAPDTFKASDIARELSELFDFELKELPVNGKEGVVETFYTS